MKLRSTAADAAANLAPDRCMLRGRSASPNRGPSVTRETVSQRLTRLELLAALTIFGLLISAGLGSVGIAQKTWLAGTGRVDANQDPRTSFEFLRRQFATLTPTSYRSGERVLIAFEGARDHVRFIAPAPEASQGAGLMTLTLALAETGSGTEVWLDLVALDPGAETWSTLEPERRIPLFRDLDGVSLSYLGAPHADAPFTWNETWPEDAIRFPEAVRLAAGNGESAWPDFQFRIQAERWR